MGIARLLAKIWVVFCLFAGGHALVTSLTETPGWPPAQTVLVCTLLFAAMGLLFIGGYAAASDHGNAPLFRSLKPHHFIPNFGDTVFVAFVALSFANQVTFAPAMIQNGAVDAVRAAIFALVPGQRAFMASLDCGLDGGRVFASAFAWLLAIIYLASSLSRLRLAAGLIRLERSKRPEPLPPAAVGFLLGVTAILGLQFLFVGSLFAYVPCLVYTEPGGELLIGLAPLMLAYLVVTALANLLAIGAE